MGGSLQISETFADPTAHLFLGRIKYGTVRTSSTMYDFKNMRLIRYGACYDVVQDAFKRFYGIQLPDDPGKDELFSGHAIESANKY